jgi:hypothetical protein
MRNKMQKIVIDRDAMMRLMRGSYEQRMQKVSEAVKASSVSFGGPSHLVSTYQDRVVIFVEQHGFFEAPYEIAENRVQLGKLSSYEIGTQDHLSRALRGFLESVNANDVVSAILEERDPREGQSDFSDQLKSILKTDRVWRQYVLPESVIVNVARYLGESFLGVHDRRYAEVNGAINGVTLTRSLLSMKEKLSEAFSDLSFAVAQYEQIVDKRTDKEAKALRDFDEAIADLVENFEEIRVLVDQGVESARAGYSKTAAQIHDAIMEDMKNIYLGQQFAVKMISDLVTV